MRLPIIIRPLFLVAALSVNFIHAASPAPQVVATLLQPLVDHHALAGAVTLVADKERILDIESVGFADIAGHQAMKDDAVFWIASMSKAMTAAGLTGHAASWREHAARWSVMLTLR